MEIKHRRVVLQVLGYHVHHSTLEFIAGASAADIAADISRTDLHTALWRQREPQADLPS